MPPIAAWRHGPTHAPSRENSSSISSVPLHVILHEVMRPPPKTWDLVTPFSSVLATIAMALFSV